MKPLGYYLNSVSPEYAAELEKSINDLDSTDKLGLIEWLTHVLKSEFDEAAERMMLAEETLEKKGGQ